MKYIAKVNGVYVQFETVDSDPESDAWVIVKMVIGAVLLSAIGYSCAVLFLSL